ncbi:MAG: DbpA RNA binding domain-containing protein, partial [Deltaproteobacteria bacterium]|nr:DbpA RNA binding domain-containing protein [Deltaproteobacteria bacterium]
TDIQRLIQRYTTDAETLLLSGDVFTVEHIHHIVYPVSEELPKPRQLVYALEMHEPRNAIVFCNTRDDTTLVCAVLNRNGFDAEVLNGDLPQKERERVMARVKAGELAFMVATDIAARGIDISGLEYVVNYSLPEDPAVYLHRVGRTGRIGNKGTAINLLSGREAMTFSTLEKKFGIKFDRRPLPSAEESLKRWTERHVAEIKEGAAAVVYEGFLPLAQQLSARGDSADLTAFLLKYYFTRHRMEKARAAGQPEVVHAPYPEEPAERPRREGRSRTGERSRGGRGERGDREGRERRPRGERERTAAPAETAPPATSEQAPAEGTAAAPANGTSAGERRPRRERAPRPEAKPIPEGSARLWVGVGRAEKVTAEGLGPALESLGAPAGRVTQVEVRGNYSYVDVVEVDVAAFEALQGKELAGRPLKIERARKPGA